MGIKSKKIRERRSKTLELIDHMLIERRQLLALLMRVSDIRNDKLSDSEQELLDEFCQVLVDYIAAGHFGLFDRIIKKQERRKNVADLAVRIYPSIDKTTQAALNFNEKYDPGNNGKNLGELHTDLSELGEDLVSRIELEDKLISRLQVPREISVT